MPITVAPSEIARNVLVCRVVGTWSWHDLHHVLKRCVVLALDISRPPNIIFDMSATDMVPPLTSLMTYRHYAETRAARYGAFIVVGTYIQANAVFYALQQVFCVGDLFFYADTRAKADMLAKVYYGAPATVL